MDVAKTNETKRMNTNERISEPRSARELLKDPVQRLEEMFKRFMAVKNTLREWAAVTEKSEFFHCEKHDRKCPIDFDRSTNLSVRQQENVLAYEPCSDCEHDKKIRLSSDWLHNKGVPRNMLHASFSNFLTGNEAGEKVASDARAFAQAGKGFLIIIGKTKGSGKTHIAVSVMRQCEQGMFITNDVLMHKVSERYSDKSNPDIIAICMKTKLLVLDDVGVSRGGVDELPTLHRILNWRHGEKLPTVITTNLGDAAFEKYIGDRMADRIKESCYAVLTVEGKSMRDQPQARQPYFDADL